MGFNFNGYKGVVVIAMLLVDPCLLPGIFVTRSLQPCHYHVACRQPCHKLVTTLYGLVFLYGLCIHTHTSHICTVIKYAKPYWYIL